MIPEPDESTDDEESATDTGLIELPSESEKDLAGNKTPTDSNYQSDEKGKLPQTSNQNSIVLTTIGLALAVGLAAFSIRRRRRN